MLGYLLTAIVWRQARLKAQFNGTLDNLLDILNNIRLSTLLEDSTTRGRVKAVYKLEEMSDEENVIAQALEIIVHNNTTYCICQVLNHEMLCFFKLFFNFISYFKGYGVSRLPLLLF